MFFNGKYSILKKMKYVADQKGIIDRYMKEAEGWALHLENTKKAIIEGAQDKKKGSCAILGSGWLLDVPIEFLSQHFETVYLFDVLHPTQIKHKLHKIPNVILVEQDITGGAIREFFDSVQMFKSLKKRKEVEDFNFNGFAYKVEFDYVVSVNILNQLDTILIDYIRGYNLYSEAELLVLREKIQQKHLDSLPKGKSCLITDCEELVYNQRNELELKSNLIYIALNPLQIKETWQWSFDRQNYRPGKNIVFQVVSLTI